MDEYTEVESTSFKPEVEEELTLVEEEKTDSSQITVIAQEVVAGHWGRGNKRNQRLIDAGYDPKEVDVEIQKIFNR